MKLLKDQVLQDIASSLKFKASKKGQKVRV